jgi:hypothetical protein
MKQSRIKEIIQEEITNVKWGRTKEVSAIFFELFKKRKTWGA